MKNNPTVDHNLLSQVVIDMLREDINERHILSPINYHLVCRFLADLLCQNPNNRIRNQLPCETILEFKEYLSLYQSQAGNILEGMADQFPDTRRSARVNSRQQNVQRSPFPKLMWLDDRNDNASNDDFLNTPQYRLRYAFNNEQWTFTRFELDGFQQHRDVFLDTALFRSLLMSSESRQKVQPKTRKELPDDEYFRSLQLPPEQTVIGQLETLGQLIDFFAKFDMVSFLQIRVSPIGIPGKYWLYLLLVPPLGPEHLYHMIHSQMTINE
ncbi:hypothetical protein BJV82DRAFT_663874 [Fennellomyces sp. T-0311]|nr:hypothetical protein BJV82DRAFT_663874 [Fennellomyces sp. T-0311]